MDSATIKHDSTLQKPTDFGMLENKLQDPCATPMYLPIDFLKAITSDFSEEQELGRGGYGVVYKVWRNSFFSGFQMLAKIIDQTHVPTE